MTQNMVVLPSVAFYTGESQGRRERMDCLWSHRLSSYRSRTHIYKAHIYGMFRICQAPFSALCMF